MSDDATPRLGLPYLAAAQAQKHVTVNEALAALDGLVAAAVQSRTLSAEPSAPAQGALYILTATPTGPSWSLLPAGDLVRFEDGAWTVLAAPVGLVAWLRDEGRLLLRTDAGWADAGVGVRQLAALERLGVGASADAANPLTVAAASSLFTHAGGDVRISLNKATAGATASLLAETGFSARAEVGLCGDDDLHVKVSADGAAWNQALTVSRADGAVGVGGAYVSGVPLGVQPGPAGQLNAGFYADMGANVSGTVVFGANLYPRSDDNTLRLRLSHATLGGAALTFNRSAFNEAQMVFQSAGAAGTPVSPTPAMTWRGADASTHANGPLYPAAYATASLPAASTCPGALATDTTLNRLVRSNGSAWVAVG